jgi:hypothetical protein
MWPRKGRRTWKRKIFSVIRQCHRKQLSLTGDLSGTAIKPTCTALRSRPRHHRHRTNDRRRKFVSLLRFLTDYRHLRWLSATVFIRV